MPPGRKRRAPPDDDAPTPAQSQRNFGRETSEDHSGDDEGAHEGSGSTAQLAKNLVRYALACEYSRVPIKRQDVNQKVLGVHTRSFRTVFDAANAQLMDVFGMCLVELPNREKVTLRQKRAAAAFESQTKSSNMWVLQTILPEQYRTSEILGPGREPRDEDADADGAYIGLYTMIISLILLCGGMLSESKLDRFLKRMNAEQSTPVDSTDKLLARMIKEGYIVRVKDSSSGEEVVDYVVGPRGKVEVGRDGVAGFVRIVYGEGVADLEQRLTRSLGIADADDGEDAATTQSVRRPGRPRARDDE